MTSNKLRDNKSGQARRSVVRGHGRRVSLGRAVYLAVFSTDHFGPRDKAFWAEKLSSEYPGNKIGDINALISRAMRLKSNE